jgi:uncharacterized protein (TIGR03000 family)
MARQWLTRPGVAALTAVVVLLLAPWAVVRAGPAEKADPAPEKRPVEITMHVPPDAQVWIDRNKTTSTGSTRLFGCPPIPRGRNYTYNIVARWTENGRSVEKKRQITFRAGDHIYLNLASGGLSVEDYDAYVSHANSNGTNQTAPASQPIPAVRYLPTYSPNVSGLSGSSSGWSGPPVRPSSEMNSMQWSPPLW